MKQLKKHIGQRIRLFREARTPSRNRLARPRKMTIQELAESSNLSVDYVTKLEHGTYMPSARAIVAIASALEVDPSELLLGAGAPATEKRAALDELRAFAAQFPSSEVRYLIRVAKAVMDRS